MSGSRNKGQARGKTTRREVLQLAAAGGVASVALFSDSASFAQSAAPSAESLGRPADAERTSYRRVVAGTDAAGGSFWNAR